jgi:hypothetical protein
MRSADTQEACEPAGRPGADDSAIRYILVWSRFPYYEVERVPEGTRVTVSDMRFRGRLGTASIVVPD